MRNLLLISLLTVAFLAVSPALIAQPAPSSPPPAFHYAVLHMPANSAGLAPSIQMAGGVALGAVAIQDNPKLDVDVNVDRNARRWTVSPVWIAIGALALLVLVALIVMGSRGEGGTTVVRG